MSATDGRISPQNVQTVADNIAPIAASFGLIPNGARLIATPAAGIPWGVVVVIPGEGRQPAMFLPRALGMSAREAHAALVAVLIALREAARERADKGPRFAAHPHIFDYYRSEWESIEGHEDAESGGVFRMQISGTGHHATKHLSITPEQARTFLATLSSAERAKGGER